MPKYLSLSEWRIASSFGPSVVLEHVTRIDTEMGFSAGTYARFEQWENEAADEKVNSEEAYAKKCNFRCFRSALYSSPRYVSPHVIPH